MVTVSTGCVIYRLPLSAVGAKSFNGGVTLHQAGAEELTVTG